METRSGAVGTDKESDAADLVTLSVTPSELIKQRKTGQM